MDWMNQYGQNDYTIQGNLQIQCSPYQITNDIFHRTRTKKSQHLYGDTKDTEQPKQSPERITELEESGSLTSNCTTKPQSSKQYGTSTKTKQKYRSMKQDRNPEISPSTYSQLIYDKGGKITQFWKDGLFNKLCWAKQTATSKRK